jgi:hypothetical protein
MIVLTDPRLALSIKRRFFGQSRKIGFFASFLSHKALKYPSTYQNMEIVNKSKDEYARI